MRPLLAVVAVLACAGCTLITDSFAVNDFSGDPYPIHVDTRSGAIMVGLREGGADRRAVLDVLSPVTVIDPGLDVPPTITTAGLLLLGERAGVVGMPDLPRANLGDKRILRIHPCGQDTATCEVGTLPAPGGAAPTTRGGQPWRIGTSSPSSA